MASITIRKLDESIKSRLRVRAAHRGRSMQVEARHVLRSALSEPVLPQRDLAEAVRLRFKAVGGVDIRMPPREPISVAGFRLVA